MGRPQKLTIENWLEIGLAALKNRGFSALKADLLTKEQAVTRGSFYYHFKDVADFHRALIQRWRETATDSVIADLDALPPGREALRSLLRLAFGAVDSLERQMRFWAEGDETAAAAIREVDRRRINYLRRVLTDMKLGDREASIRAEILYDAYIGYCWRDARKTGQLDEFVAELLRFAES